MAEQTEIGQMMNQLTPVDFKVIFGALDMNDQSINQPKEEPTNEVESEGKEKSVVAESPPANQPEEEVDIDDLLNCLTETYAELYNEPTTANNPIQQQNVQAPAEYTFVSNEFQHTGQTSAIQQYTPMAGASVYTEMPYTNQQQQYPVPQFPAHWPTLNSIPNNFEKPDFTSPQIYKCNYCRKQYLSKAAHTRHINNYHAKRHLRCWECGFFPVSGETLLRHDFYYHSHSRRYFYNVPTF